MNIPRICHVPAVRLAKSVLSACGVALLVTVWSAVFTLVMIVVPPPPAGTAHVASSRKNFVAPAEPGGVGTRPDAAEPPDWTITGTASVIEPAPLVIVMPEP